MASFERLLYSYGGSISMASAMGGARTMCMQVRCRICVKRVYVCRQHTKDMT